MFTVLPLLLFGLFFVIGYSTRSYVGAAVPLTLLALAVVAFAGRTETGDEVDVQPFIVLVASTIGVLVYLGGVALGRRSRPTPRATRS